MLKDAFKALLHRTQLSYTTERTTKVNEVLQRKCGKLTRLSPMLHSYTP